MRSQSLKFRTAWFLPLMVAALLSVGLTLLLTQSVSADAPTDRAADHEVVLDPAGARPGETKSYTLTVTNERNAGADAGKISAVLIDVPGVDTALSTSTSVVVLSTSLTDLAPPGWDCGKGGLGATWQVDEAGNLAWFWCVASAPEYYVGTSDPVDPDASPLTYSDSIEFSFTARVNDVVGTEATWTVRVMDGGGTATGLDAGDGHDITFTMDDKEPSIREVSLSDTIMPDADETDNQREDPDNPGQFIGTDTTPDSDDGQDGNIDRARVLFSEGVDPETVTKEQWRVGGKAPASVEEDTTTSGVVDDTAFFLIFAADSQVDGTGEVEVEYAPRGGAVKDLAGNTIDTQAESTTDIDVKDEAVPVVTSIVTGDDDGNGKIDLLVVSFSEAMEGDEEDGWTIAGSYILESARFNADDDVITIRLEEMEDNVSGDVVTVLFDTDAIPEVTYNINDGDLAGKTGETGFTDLDTIVSGEIVTKDGAAPVVAFEIVEDDVEVPLVSVTGKTIVEITFNEEIAPAATPEGEMENTFKVDHAGFEVPGSTVMGAELENTGGTVDDATVVVLTLESKLEADATPNVSYGPGTVADAAGKTVAAFTKRAKDEVGPTLVSITLGDTNSNREIDEGDTLTFVFDEPIRQITIIPDEADDLSLETVLPVTAGDARKGDLTYGTGATAVFTTSEVLTVTVGADANIQTGDKVAPISTVTDKAGKLDDEGEAQGDNFYATPDVGVEIVEVTISLSVVNVTRGTGRVSTVVTDYTNLNKGDTITVAVNISNVENLDAVKYTIVPSGYLTLVSVAAGSIGSDAIPVSQKNDNVIVQNVPDRDGVTGSGRLATATFTFWANSGQSPTSTVGVIAAELSNKDSEGISVNTAGLEDEFSSRKLAGDATGDSTLSALDVTEMERIVAGLYDDVTEDTQTVVSPSFRPSIYDPVEGDSHTVLDITKTEERVANAQ